MAAISVAQSAFYLSRACFRLVFVRPAVIVGTLNQIVREVLSGMVGSLG